MARDEERGAYSCPAGLDPYRWCDVELRRSDLWDDLHCLRCGWQGRDIPQEDRYWRNGVLPYAQMTTREERGDGA